MAFYDQVWYCNFGNGSSTGYFAVTVRPQNTAVAAGILRRQFTAPAVGSERCFVCIVAGTTANVTDATWVLTRAALTTDGTASWRECTGVAALNGDATNTATWGTAKVIGNPSIGAIIKRNNGASYQICTTAGAQGASEPAFSDTAGVTTNDGGAVWTSLGPVGNFTGGGAPHARLASACASTWFAAGNTVYVGDSHAESQATAITINPVGSTATVGRIICHNHSGSYPPTSTDLTTGATVSTTGNVTTSITPAGSLYVYGVAFKAAVGVAGSAGTYITLSPQVGSPGLLLYFDSCSLEIAATASGAWLQIGSNVAGVASSFVFNNTTTKFGSTGQFINVTNNQLVWQNTGQVLVSGSSVPSVFFQPSSTVQGAMHNITLEALDLSQLTGVLCGSSAIEVGVLLIKDCKLNASATVTTPAATGIIIQLVRSDSGATAYKSTRYAYEGTETTETTITRVGGSVDPTGQAQSRKIVTTANAQWLRPFKAEPYAIWNAVTSANVVVTVCGIINAGAMPSNDDIWMEAEYLGSSSSPLGTIVNTTKANVLAANAAVASDSSTWNNLTATTFDGTPSASVVMSNGNLTVTHGSTGNGTGVSSTFVLTAGKYYFEVTLQVSTSNTNGVGVKVYAGGVFSDPVASFTSGVGVLLGPTSSVVNSDGVNTGKDLGVSVVGNVFGCAIDLTARLAWFRKNGGNWNGDAAANPATGVGGVAVPAGAMAPMVRFTNGLATDRFTANFGATAFAFTAPSGFIAGWNGWSPFKLTTTLSSPQPGMAGYIHARVRAAKPSTTYYIDPQVILS